ncbi:RNA-binding domain-containing protein [Phascolarctobacterium succinatutens]|uniref:RNA-binding domain-containing protein n=4 Tax=Phascolarctobacterium succinatutens TaxID=626940 RepID=UPI0026EF4770|nr:RNA-binding domain-containing protein [Phascolarctobacterium succinatutens]MBS5427437.1 putative DNA binding domain-containing protein [Phascolarctobacterium succinatutens]
MRFRETETVELKSIVMDDIKKEIIAFANCDGGTVYVGVADDGKVLGVENADECALQISNMVRDAVKPDVTMFIHYETLECDGKAVVAVNIQRGTNRPYYLAKKGLRPEGVYVRQGYSSVPATDTAIRQMIKETDGDSFENMRSINQALTFEATKKEFEKRNVVFGQPQMQTLKIVSADGIYTNLGLLLSEQCLHTIKAAVFEGINQNVFKDRREFSGSLMQQLNDVYDYIDFHNQTHATFRKLLRIDTRDYPEVAVREALLNTLVHRDYSFRASTLISIYDDRIEFVSIGGLLPGLELDDLMMGVSVCRNPHLANVFYRLQLIEAYGTGMKKIMGAYANALVQPKIKTTNNAFKIILPNVNFTPKAAEVHKDFEKAADLALDSNEEKVLQFLREHLMITRKETQTLLEVSQSTAGRILKAMVDSGRIKQIGGSRTTRYELRKE